MSNGSKWLFTDLKQELEREPLHIQGIFPEWLSGTLFRNGPAKSMEGHLFDGLAMIHKFTIDHGCVTYSNRFLRTPAYDQAMTNGQALSGFASPSASGAKGYNANVSIARIDHHFAAMTESPDIVAFNPCTLGTIGVLPYEDDLPAHYTTAHPHYDFRQKSMFNFTVQFGRTCSYHVYGLPDGTRRRKRIGTVETTAPAYMHSFAMTENYIVLVEFPLIFNPLELMQGEKSIADSMHWMPERGTRFLVVGKNSGKLERVFESDSYFSFHLINAFEKQGDIFIDACAMKKVSMGSINPGHLSDPAYNPSNQPAMLRFRLSPGKTVAAAERLIVETMEFPGIHYRWSNASEYRYAYGTSTNRNSPESIENQLVKVDTHFGTAKSWFQEGHYPGEPVFVASPEASSEDDGVILSVVLDGDAGSSYLLALDAITFEELGRAVVPHHIPYGFHGLYTNELFNEEEGV
ncbi:carotenoid oxygenase family protein [Paenibacillus sp. FSL W8-0194]|uniref:carotenoid oxygenase family protein n=1 Tax=Paenibacillus sp. FSL W8-0194 TaxID=2921711 RepID=UPI0030DA8EEF